MKKISINLFFVFIITTGCKKDIEINNPKSALTQSDTLKNDLGKEITCDEVIFDVVKSSNLNLKDYKNYFVRIEDIKNDSISVQVYFENNLSDNPKEKQIVESTIAWLLFLPNEKKLYNVTADPENPIQLKYEFIDLNILYKSCNIKKRKIVKSQITDNENKDCKTITVEMGKGEECLVKNTTIENVYTNIIANKEVDDFDYLLNSIPKNNKTIEINKNGLMNIEYKIEKDKVEITFSYEGVITEVNIEKINNNIIKRIIYYAD